MYTSYYANLRKIPKWIVPITISNSVPEFARGFSYYSKLIPPWDVVRDYKDGAISWDKFIDIYKDVVLSGLNAKDVVDELTKLSGGNPWVLMCYESSDKPCHRHIVAEWLTEAGFRCREFEGVN